MDQNLEPKGDMEEQRTRKLKAKRVSLKKSGIYFLGDSCSTSFVGYISGAMTDGEIQEYIEVQERLKPLSVKERERAPQSQTPVEDANMEAPTSKINLSKSLETPDQPEDDEDAA